MSAGFLNPAAGLGSTMSSDPAGDLIARQKLAEILTGGRGRYNDSSPKQHWMQAVAQMADGAMEGLSARQQLVAALAGQQQASDIARSMPFATAAAAQGTAAAAPAAGASRAPASIPGSVGGLDDNNLDVAVRTAMAEAGGMGAPGIRDVAAVLRNRALLSGRSVADEALAKNQFEPWNPGSKNDPRRFKADSPEYQAALAAVRPILDGSEPDPTGGATFFYAPKAQAALGRRPPKWDDGSGEDRGLHRFFRLPYAGKDPASLARAQAGGADTLQGGAGSDSLAGGAGEDDLRAQLEAALAARRSGAADLPAEGAQPVMSNPMGDEDGTGFVIPPGQPARAPTPAPQPAASPDLAALTAPAPMGAPQSFTPSAGSPAPTVDAAQALRDAPLPPQRPSDAELQPPARPQVDGVNPATAPAQPATRLGRQQLASALTAPQAPPAPPSPQGREGLAALLGGVQDGLDRVFGGPETQARLDAQGGPGPWGASDGRGGLINRLFGLDGAAPAAPAGAPVPAQASGSPREQLARALVPPPQAAPPQPTSYAGLSAGAPPRAAPASQGAPTAPAPAPQAAPAPDAPAAPQRVAQAPQSPAAGGPDHSANVAWAQRVMAQSAANPAVAKFVPLAQEILKGQITPKMDAPFDYEGGKVQRDPSTGEYKWVVKPGDAAEKYQHVQLPGGGVFAFNPANPDTSRIILPGQPARPLTPEERKAFGIPEGQGAMMTPEGPKGVGGGGTTVNVDTKGAGKFKEVANTKQAERYGKMMEAADEAVAIRGDIDTLADLGSKIATGRLAEAKLGIAQYAKALGADDLANSLTGGKMSEMEAYQALADKLAPRMRVPGSGATSDYEMRVFRNSLPSLLKTPGGNAIAVDTFRSLYDYQAAVGEIAGQALRDEITQKDADAQIKALESPFTRFKEYRKEAAREGGAPSAPAPAAAAPAGQPPRVRRYNPATGTLE